MIIRVDSVISTFLRSSFGDGTTGNGASATHTYTKDGLFTVTVSAIDLRLEQSGALSGRTLIWRTAPGGAARPVMSETHERRWAMSCHLMALSGILIPFGNVLGPLAVWLWKRKESEFIDFHGGAVKFHDQHRFGFRKARMDGRFRRFECETVHHFDGSRDDTGGDDR